MNTNDFGKPEKSIHSLTKALMETLHDAGDGDRCSAPVFFGWAADDPKSVISVRVKANDNAYTLYVDRNGANVGSMFRPQPLTETALEATLADVEMTVALHQPSPASEERQLVLSQDIRGMAEAMVDSVSAELEKCDGDVYSGYSLFAEERGNPAGAIWVRIRQCKAQPFACIEMQNPTAGPIIAPYAVPAELEDLIGSLNLIAGALGVSAQAGAPIEVQSGKDCRFILVTALNGSIATEVFATQTAAQETMMKELEAEAKKNCTEGEWDEFLATLSERGGTYSADEYGATPNSAWSEIGSWHIFSLPNQQTSGRIHELKV